MDKGQVTALTKVNNIGASLRTTVPSGIVKQLGLDEGDKLNWKIEILDNEFILIVKPKKS